MLQKLAVGAPRTSPSTSVLVSAATSASILPPSFHHPYSSFIFFCLPYSNSLVPSFDPSSPSFPFPPPLPSLPGCRDLLKLVLTKDLSPPLYLTKVESKVVTVSSLSLRQWCHNALQRKAEENAISAEKVSAHLVTSVC